jgi:hypothetical protein
MKKNSKFKCNKVSVLIILVLVPQSNCADGVSEVVLSLSHQKGKKPKTTQNKKNTINCPKFR